MLSPFDSFIFSIYLVFIFLLQRVIVISGKEIGSVEDSTTSYDGRVACNIETSSLSLVACQSYLCASSVYRLLQQTNAEEWICFQHMQTAIADECWCNKLRQFYFVLALHDTLDDAVASFPYGGADSSATAGMAVLSHQPLLVKKQGGLEF